MDKAYFILTKIDIYVGVGRLCVVCVCGREASFLDSLTICILTTGSVDGLMPMETYI